MGSLLYKKLYMKICYNILSIITVSLIMSSCGIFDWFSSTKSVGIPAGFEKKEKIYTPGGTGNNWRYLGSTKNGLLVDEIDAQSISLQNGGNKIYTYKDRKTVIYPNLFTYPSSQPRFKFLISTWQINCESKQYNLKETVLYNESSQKITSYNYYNQPKWQNINDKSFSNLQFGFVCLNINKSLGY